MVMAASALVLQAGSSAAWRLPSAAAAAAGAAQPHTDGQRRSGLTSSNAARLVPLRASTRPQLRSSTGGLRASAPRAQAAAGSAVKEVDVPKDVAEAYKHLQNGSDVRGVAVEGVPNQPVNLTPESAGHIARGYIGWLREKRRAQSGKASEQQLKVSVGNDPRISGPALKDAVVKGLTSLGVHVTDFALCTTPAMFMSTVTEAWNYDGAIMLTASHLPYNRNGLKFFTPEGGTNKGDISDILKRAAASSVELPSLLEKQPPSSLVDERDFLPVYAKQLQDVIKKGINHPTNYDRPLEGFHILVDAGNGSGGFIADAVLQPLGADTTGSQFLDPDGSFPNHVPNPEDKKAIEMTKEAVLKHKADLGIVLDTDVDRSGCVDFDGSELNRNYLIGVLATIVLKENPGATIVSDSVVSNGLIKFVAEQGGTLLRYRKGYKNIIDKGIELNKQGVDVPLMVETSGHGAMRENYFLDDGAYLALKLVVEMVRRSLAGQGRIGEAIATMQSPADETEVRLNMIPRPDFQSPGGAIVAAFRDFAASGKLPHWHLEDENYEGWRVRVDEGDGKEGWVLLRQSLHDPLLPLNVESDVANGCSAIIKDLYDNFLRDNKLVDGILELKNLEPFLK
eukprot:jgi/Chlat1/5446/Chrsp36S05444